MDNFSDRYVAYARAQTDAPPVFHRFLSYLIVSSVVNKNCWVPFGYKKMYPNLFLLIVAPSSAHRKSWSMSIASRLITEIHPDFVIPEMSSREAFIAELADEARIPAGAGLIEIDELKGFMDRAKRKSYMEGFIQDLSTLYDGRALNRRKGVEEPERYKVAEPFLNMVAACSNEWLYQSVESQDIAGGFFARFIWVVYEEKISAPEARPGKPDLLLHEELVNRLNRMAQYIGAIDFTPESADIYARWYTTFYKTHQGGFWDANYHRAAVIIQKFAALNALMRTEATSEVPAATGIHILPVDLKLAILLIEDTLLNFRKVTIGDSRLDMLTKKILKRLIDKGDHTKSQLLRSIYGINTKDLDTILPTLEQSECVTVAKTIGGGLLISPTEYAKEYLARAKN